MTSSRLAGLRRSVLRVEREVTQRPLMKFLQICVVDVAVAMAVSSRSISSLGVLGDARAHDFAVGIRTAVAVKLPGRAHLLDFIEVQFGHEQFIPVPAGL